MVLPLVIAAGAVGGGAYLADKLGVLDAENAAEIVADTVADTAVGVISIIPTILGRLAPAVVEGVGEAVGGVLEALEGREVAFMTGLTAMIIGYAGFRSLKSMTGGAAIATN